MELTLQEQQNIDKLDADLQHTKTIDNLKQGQEDIRQDISNERDFNKSEFAKGTEKFREIFDELKEVRSEVNDMKSQIATGFIEQKRAFEKHILDGKEDEIKKLNKRLDARDQIKNGVIITFIGGTIVWLVVEVLKGTVG